MRLTYKTLSVDEHGIELSFLKNQGTEFYVFQATPYNRKRLKRCYQSAQCFFSTAPDYFLKPVSYKEDADIVTALYGYVSAGDMQTFLEHSKDHMQYAVGKRTGRALLALHDVYLTEEQKQKAIEHQKKCKEKFSIYLNSLERMPNDGKTIEAIGARFDSFTIFKPVMRYGGLKVSNIMLTADLEVVFKPCASFGPGDLCEDLALIACENAAQYPCFVAGVIDGYFALKIPTNFYIGFALHCAINSLYRCAKRSEMDSNEKSRMINQSMQIQDDFMNFKTPIPVWYGTRRVKNARALCERKNL